MTRPSKIYVQVEPDESATTEELSKQAILLRRSILETPVMDVTFTRDSEAKPGSKAADASNLGQLVITAVPTTSLLGLVIKMVIDRLRRPEVRSIRLEIDGDSLDVTNLSQESQDKLIQHWIRRHATGS